MIGTAPCEIASPSNVEERTILDPFATPCSLLANRSKAQLADKVHTERR